MRAPLPGPPRDVIPGHPACRGRPHPIRLGRAGRRRGGQTLSSTGFAARPGPLPAPRLPAPRLPAVGPLQAELRGDRRAVAQPPSTRLHGAGGSFCFCVNFKVTKSHWSWRRSSSSAGCLSRQAGFLLESTGLFVRLSHGFERLGGVPWHGACELIPPRATELTGFTPLFPREDGVPLRPPSRLVPVLAPFHRTGSRPRARWLSGTTSRRAGAASQWAPLATASACRRLPQRPSPEGAGHRS